MATQTVADDKLVEEARRIGRHKTKRETIVTALREYIERRKQLRILNLFGTVEYERGYDCRAERRRKRM